MPILSDFTPFGQLEFSSDASDAEKIYDNLRSGYVDPRTGKDTISMAPGTHQEAKVYGWAMAIADARITLRRAGLQLQGETAYDELRAHEERFSVVPGTDDTVAQRQAVLAAKRRAPGGPRLENVLGGLKAILGSAFLSYRTIAPADASVWPAAPQNGPGVFPPVDIPARVVRLIDPVVAGAGWLGYPPFVRTVYYENWNPLDAEVSLRKGDSLAVQPEQLGLAEKVTVLEVAGVGATRRFTAAFTKHHDQYASATTGPMPIWRSTKRTVFIVVKAVAAVDPELVRRVDEFMGSISRAVTQWAIVQPSSPGALTIGPFTLDSSPLGAVPVDVLSFEIM